MSAAAGEELRFGRSTGERAAMFAVFVGNGIGFGAWAGNIPRVKEAAGLGDASLGLVLLGLSVGAVAAMPVAGRYGARLGTGRVCWMAGLLVAVALVLPGLAVMMPMGGWLALLASAGLLGASLGIMDVCMNTHAAWVERRWGAAIMSSFHAGWSVGQLLGAGLAGVLAWAGLGLLPALAWSGAAVALGGLGGLALPGGAEVERGPERGGGMRFALPGRALLVLCALVAASFAIEGGTADWSGVFLRTVLGVPARLASVPLGVFAGSMVVMRLGGDWLVRRFGAGRVVSWGGVLAGLGIAVALVSPGMWGATAGFALVGVGVANIVPVVFSAAGRRGTAGVATVATAGYGAVMATPPLIGFVSEGFGLRAGLLVLVGAACVVGVLGRAVAGGEEQRGCP